MGSLKKFDGSSWINSNLRKLTTDTDTFTTFPAIIYAEGTDATVGLKGNTVQNGTPTPDSPVMPEGTGERTGNLYSGTDISSSINNAYYKNDFVYANLNQGIYTLAFDLETSATDTYRSSIGVGTTGYSKDIQAQPNKTDGHFVFTFTIEAEDAGKNLYARFARFSTQVTITYTASNIMLNTGTTPLPYEPYGYKIPILSNSTTTPVYLGEVQTTRKIREFVLDGTENWVSDSGFFHTHVNSLDFRNTTNGLICSHLPVILRDDFNGRPSAFWGRALAGDMCLCISNAITTLDAFKSYLSAQYAAGTPVTVWYVLATEETAVVNEPLMKIGDYADTVSGISIPVTAGGDTLSVGTTIQPPEVTANYYGWHTITVHERESGQWD